MKKIKAINGYTIFQSMTDRDEYNYNCSIGSYNIYFSSDIREYGIKFSEVEFENIDGIEVAEEICNGSNYAMAKEIVEESTTATTFEEIEKIEAKLDAGMTVEEIECYPEIEDYPEELQKIKVNGYVGKWSAIEKCTVNGTTYYFMEHEYYGDETCFLVIDETQETVLETYDGLIQTLIDENII